MPVNVAYKSCKLLKVFALTRL